MSVSARVRASACARACLSAHVHVHRQGPRDEVRAKKDFKAREGGVSVCRETYAQNLHVDHCVIVRLDTILSCRKCSTSRGTRPAERYTEMGETESERVGKSRGSESEKQMEA